MVQNVVAAPPVRDRHDRPSLMAGLVMFLACGGVLPGYIILSSDLSGDSGNIVLALVIVLWDAAALAKLAYWGAGQVVRLAFYVFCYCFLGISVLAQIADDSFPLLAPDAGSYSNGLIRRAEYAIVLSIVAFEVGAVIARAIRRKSTHKLERPRTTVTVDGNAATLGRWVSQRRVLALGIVGLAVTAYFLSRTGLAPFFNSRQAAGNALLGSDETSKVYSAADKGSRATFRALAQAPIMLALFGSLYMRRYGLWNRLDTKRNVGAGLVVALLVVGNLIINSPLSNSRYWFSTVAITIVSVYLRLDKARAIRWAAFSSIAVLLFAFTTLQAFRRTGGPQDYSVGFRNDLISSGTYSEFQVELVALNWLKVHPHTHGRQLAAAMLVFVPRSVWQDKPPDTGNLIIPKYNPAASLWTEGEVEAGPLGIAGYFVVLGVAATALDRRLRRAQPGSVAHAAIPIAGGFTVLILRGSLLTVVGAAYGLFLAITFISRWYRGRGAAKTGDPTGASDAAVPVRQLAINTRPKHLRIESTAELPGPR